MFYKKEFKNMVFVCMLLLLAISYPASAATTEKNLSNVSNTIEKIGINLPGKSVSNLKEDGNAIKMNNNKEENKKTKLMAESNTTISDIIDVTGSITTSAAVNYYTFSVDSDRTMIMSLSSSNSDYVAQLGIVDLAQGLFTPTNVYVFSGEKIILDNLPTGDYAIRVFSNSDTVGQDYNLYMNAVYPKNTKEILELSELSTTYVGGTLGKVCKVGGYAFDINGDPIANRRVYITNKQLPSGTIVTEDNYQIGYAITDSNGYYSTDVATLTTSYKYYYAYLASTEPFTQYQWENLDNKSTWPAPWLFEGGGHYWSNVQSNSVIL